jgi:hypothetical protein
MMGGSPSAHLFAELPDGTKLWDDGAKYRRSMAKQGTLGSSSGDTGNSISAALPTIGEHVARCDEGSAIRSRPACERRGRTRLHRVTVVSTGIEEADYAPHHLD